MALTPDRDRLYQEATDQLHYQAEVYLLGERFANLPFDLASVVMLDVTRVPGCHYGLKNIFVPIIRRMEEASQGRFLPVHPNSTILVEPSTGNGWVAFSDAAELLGYVHEVVMPDGLPEARYLHPSGREVKINKTPKEKYAAGMPEMLGEMTSLRRTRKRLGGGLKPYVSPNHAVGIRAIDITVDTMSELGKQLVDKLHPDLPLTVIASMGNGASVCALGEYVKTHTEGARVIATESLAYGGGYDWFARLHNWPRYFETYGFRPGRPELMAAFKTYGTNAPIEIEMPLQGRAINGPLIDSYVLYTDDGVFASSR